MQKKLQKETKNYAVIIYENNYSPNTGGIATLIGIYPTHRAASFISKVVKERNKLPFFPIVEPTNFTPTTYFVEDYLERLDAKKEKEALKDQL